MGNLLAFIRMGLAITAYSRIRGRVAFVVVSTPEGAANRTMSQRSFAARFGGVL